MLIQDFGSDLLTEINLGFAVVAKMSLKFDDVEVEMIQRCAHRIKPIFRFDDQFVISMRVRPVFLLLGKGAVAALAPPFLARTANPTVENLSIRKVDDLAELAHQVGELDTGFLAPQLMADLIGNRSQRAVVIGWSHGNQDQMLSIFQPIDDLFSGFLPPEFCEVLFDILGFQRAGFQRTLADNVLH